jgi:hypothetical protein
MKYIVEIEIYGKHSQEAVKSEVQLAISGINSEMFEGPTDVYVEGAEVLEVHLPSN